MKMRKQFRFFFREIAEMIYNQRESIKTFITKGLKPKSIKINTNKTNKPKKTNKGKTRKH